MLFSKSILLPLFAFAATSFAAPIQSSEQEVRAPHPFQIASPADGATVSSAFLVKLLDGNQSDEYYAQASLKDTTTGKETAIVSRRRFDGYVVEAQVDASGFAAGSYQFIARESNEAGEIVDTLTQALTIS